MPGIAYPQILFQPAVLEYLETGRHIPDNWREIPIVDDCADRQRKDDIR